MEPEGKQSVVWILGSGFSKPLGGPLLDELISMQMVGDFSNWPDFYHEPNTPEGDDKVKCAEAVYEIYERGIKPPSKLWSNAEEFLERLDVACQTTTNLWPFRIRQLGTDHPQTKREELA